jgi:hypothetical protein
VISGVTFYERRDAPPGLTQAETIRAPSRPASPGGRPPMEVRTRAPFRDGRLAAATETGTGLSTVSRLVQPHRRSHGARIIAVPPE